MLDQRLLDVGEERRRIERAQAAAPTALLGAAEDQPILGARHADIEQPALLRDRRVVRLAPVQRQEPVFEPDDEHDREFEPLGGVQRQQRYALGARIEEVDLARQRHRIEHAGAVAVAGLRQCDEALQGRVNDAADEGVTRRVRQALALVDVRLLDHLIVGDGQCYSFSEHGLL